jgi:signal transduction histidine kinase
MAESSATQVYLILAVGTAAMLFMAGAIILFVVFYQKRMIQQQLLRRNLEMEYQQKMLLAALESQENERKRVAADLHDGVGSMLSAIRLSLSTLERNDSITPDTLEPIRQNKLMLDETIESVRKISRDLLPSTLAKFGLSTAVKEMAGQYGNVSNVSITFSEAGTSKSLTKTDEIMVFRIVQELINNALKHSRSDRITVAFDWHANLIVQVCDTGIGFDQRNKSSGLGLFNMQNRARLLGASLRFEKNEPKGTCVTLSMPEQK